MENRKRARPAPEPSPPAIETPPPAVQDGPPTTSEPILVLETLPSAAAKLGLTSASLRGRCRRAGKRVGDVVVALLPDGVVGFKVGREWKLRFPKDAAAPPTAATPATEKP